MKQHPATPTRAAKVARAVATIMSIVLAFCTAMFTYQQNEISEKVGRIEALSKPLTYSVSASDDTDVELSFQESGQPTISAAGKTIDVVPATGGISQISSVVFANGTVAANHVKGYAAFAIFNYKVKRTVCVARLPHS